LNEGDQRRFFALAADPILAQRQLEIFAHRQPEALRHLVGDPNGLQMLSLVFTYSRVLTDDLFQHPEWLTDLLAEGTLYRPYRPGEFQQRLEFLAGDRLPSALELATFRRRQILRILLRDAVGLASLAEVTGELTALADAMLEVTGHGLFTQLACRYGLPLTADLRPCRFVILALGKLGGEELNYSSDIDLMYLYSANGATAGRESISNKEFFKKLANAQTELLSAYTPEGFCYRIDLRLRPDGRLGDVALSLDGAKAYYEKRARDWELQMLIKCRPAAGDLELGREFLNFTEPLTYSTTLDFTAVEAVAESRERIHEKAAAKRQTGGLNIKLMPGGIRDIEFLVQCLQRLHGGREQWLRHGGTQLALGRLRDKDLISLQEHEQLSKAYEFFRYAEHRLQILEDRQTHTLPADPDALESLARRMPIESVGGIATRERLNERLSYHLGCVQELYERVIHAHRPAYLADVLQTGPHPDPVPARPWSQPVAANVVRHLDHTAPALASLVAEMPLQRGVEHFARFLDAIRPRPELLDQLDADPPFARRLLDLFEYSTFYAEELQRLPDLASALDDLDAPFDPAELRHRAEACGNAVALRQFFRREMLHLQAGGFLQRRPIFRILEQTSHLADSVIQAAYLMAVDTVSASEHLPPRYHPLQQLVVVALGRLGMREFDLASDADLVFVLPDADERARLFWTHVAERLIEMLTAYTTEGTLIAVDARLRPNGKAGPLVQLESGYKQYFAETAEPWEGISYMKSRVVAGDAERGTAFLNELQEIDWRRCGQSMRSRASLRDMRARLEREQGATQKLKSGPGAFYDIDFILMYLRLKGAGIYFPVLNTPQRIDVVEKMGHLDHDDAIFLHDAATFFRAVDHALRFYSGHSAAALPANESVRRLLADMVSRWVPGYDAKVALDETLAGIQRATRALFDRVFH
jgi:glutamate-ammonia-ligase adenylyltransferase